MFQEGNKEFLKRSVNNGGRPPKHIVSIRDELDEHPERIRKVLDEIYKLATTSESEKIRSVCSADYLTRLGFRAPKETNINVSGGVVIGTPEDYRRSMLLMAQDKEREAALLSDSPQTLQDGCDGPPNKEVISITNYEITEASTDATLATIPYQNETK